MNTLNLLQSVEDKVDQKYLDKAPHVNIIICITLYKTVNL